VNGELDLDDGALAGLDHGVKDNNIKNQVVVVKSLEMGNTMAEMVEQKSGQSFWLET